MPAPEVWIAGNCRGGSVAKALADLDAGRVVERIWERDHTVWSDSPDEIANRLDWLGVAEETTEEIPRLERLAADVREAGIDDVLLLGMGGSSLAPEVLAKTFGSAPGHPRLRVLDSTHPDAVVACRRNLDPARTLFVVATKSGGTVETLSLLRYFWGEVVSAVGDSRAGGQFVAITDPGSSLADTAARHGFRATFLNNPEIGGRYSALSFFGMVPAALVGADAARLLRSGIETAAACRPGRPAGENPGASLGAALGSLALEGRDKVTFVVSEGIESFGDWGEQLIAESTGKDGRGILPVVGVRPRAPDSYGGDRVFVDVRLAGDESGLAELGRLEEAGHPVLTIPVADVYGLGGLFFLWEFATAVGGHVLGVNPFDQPDVESAKIQARAMVAAYEKDGRLPALPPTFEEDGTRVVTDAGGSTLAEALPALLDGARPADYVAVQAYVERNPEADAALAELRRALCLRTRLATTVGYGPRFLHSTGQLHKGDRGNGLFIQIVDTVNEDVPIPSELGSGRSAVTFGVLRDAQALGDRSALLEAGRRVLRLEVGVDAPAAIRRVAAALGQRGL